MLYTNCRRQLNKHNKPVFRGNTFFLALSGKRLKAYRLVLTAYSYSEFKKTLNFFTANNREESHETGNIV